MWSHAVETAVGTKMTTPTSKRREYRGRDRVIRTVVTTQLSVVENLSWNSGHEPGDPMVIVPATDFDRYQQRLARAAELLVIILNNADRMNTTQYKVVFQNSYLRRIQAFLNEGNNAPAPGEKGEG